MYSINNVSLSKVVEDDVGRSSPDQNDRFERRLNNYRIHQIDCQLKNDESFREMREQESVHIKRLQEQKTCDRRQKRVNKKQSKKNKVCCEVKKIIYDCTKKLYFRMMNPYHNNNNFLSTLAFILPLFLISKTISLILITERC